MDYHAAFAGLTVIDLSRGVAFPCPARGRAHGGGAAERGHGTDEIAKPFER